MKKDEMVSVLAIAGADPKTIDAMSEAYEMGFEYGSKAYAYLTDAVESAREVCKLLDNGDDAQAREHTQFFWSAIKKLQELE